jgi:hypothetical protein
VEATRLFLEHGANVNAQDGIGLTPLHIASAHGKPANAQVLLMHGADVKARDKDNETPLHQAKVKEAAQILLEHGADPNALATRNRQKADEWVWFGSFSSMVYTRMPEFQLLRGVAWDLVDLGLVLLSRTAFFSGAFGGLVLSFLVQAIQLLCPVGWASESLWLRLHVPSVIRFTIE